MKLEPFTADLGTERVVLSASHLCKNAAKNGREAWRENAVGDTSAGPIFHRDSRNEEKNPPGG